jgi:heat shock protein HtpX
VALQTVGLKTHIWNNNIKAGLLLAGFPLLLALLAFGLALLASGTGLGLEKDLRRALALMPALLPACFAIAGVWFAIAFLAHRRILNGITGARSVTREAETRLWNITENLCISRGLPMPRLAVIETAERNAYASGLSPRDAQVTVTRGLIDALDDREIAAVVAHELTHLRNGDARLALIAAVFAGILSLVAEVIVRGGMRVRMRGGDRRAGAAALIGLVIILAAAALATALRFALSRNREFLADAGAVELTQDADAMASALRRIEGRSEIPRLPSQVQAMLLDWPGGTRGVSLWATHPSIEARIEALARVAGARDPGPLPDPPPPEVQPDAPAAAEGVPWWQAGATPLEGPTPENPWGKRSDTRPPPSP